MYSIIEIIINNEDTNPEPDPPTKATFFPGVIVKFKFLKIGLPVSY